MSLYLTFVLVIPVASARFVKCESCNQFYMVMPQGNTTQTAEEVKLEEKKKIPYPKEVCQFFSHFWSEPPLYGFKQVLWEVNVCLLKDTNVRLWN